MMSNAETITVGHLGTSTIGYKLGRAYDASLPTLVMVDSFTTSVEQYRPQFADEELTATANLPAIEPYGHGRRSRDLGCWDGIELHSGRRRPR
jgi:hypothetical protein